MSPVLIAAIQSGSLTDWIQEQTGSTLLAGLVGPTVEVLLILVGAFILSKIAKRLIAEAVEEMKDPENAKRIKRWRKRTRISALEGERVYSARRAQRADALGALARSIAAVLIWGMAIFMILGAFNIDLAPLIAGAGIVGVAVGFGAQDLVKDFLSGVFMLMEDQYGVGDVIDAGDAVGVVESISLRSTEIRSVNGTKWHVPNGEIRRVGNMSQQWARALLDIEVAYDTDLDDAVAVIGAVAHEFAQDENWLEKVLEEPEVWGVESLGSSGIALRLVIKTTPGDQWMAMRELRRRIKAAFDEAGIEIPFPQQTTWLRTDATGTDVPRILLGGRDAE